MAQLTWDELKDNLRQKFPTVFITAEQLSECLQELDAVPVVRCKDCKYGSPNGRYGCKCYHYKLYETHEMSPNDFCSHAERREDE